MDKIVYILSGEFFLRCRPNGGTVVLLRSAYVSLLIYVPALVIKVYCSTNAVLHFSPAAFRIELGDTLPWLGAVFAGAYAAFYTRFSSQWSYLANLYNQIMFSNVMRPETDHARNIIEVWWAAFIEDAQDLHLAGKSMFKSIIIDCLTDADTVRVFLQSTDNSNKRLKDLERVLNFKAADPLPAADSQSN